MNPMAPVSMLSGMGSGKAVLVVAALVALVIFAKSSQGATLTQTTTPRSN
ncbi:hypothetical protein [Rhodocyclus tenuis]|uniref:Uncharacterized protein n=1 Tax=Rhodocyclus tenuis TaxID=1066 RepID=A0A840G852_RHOTE|nr:hypothetical protein [Rhodocyclus tenuis]MBB4248513.1 hypothetical protein [Rhodocyclus tenuis]